MTFLHVAFVEGNTPTHNETKRLPIVLRGLLLKHCKIYTLCFLLHTLLRNSAFDEFDLLLLNH